MTQNSTLQDHRDTHTYSLVYQCGLANVFQHTATGLRRIVQSAFTTAEMFCLGAKHAGAVILVSHCDQAGDIAGAEWTAGAGEMFGESKCPPLV